MKRNTVLIAVILVIGVVTTILIRAQGQEDTVPPDQVNKAIQSFIQLARKSDMKSFGLENISQLETATAGKQFKNYMIGLDDVRKYKSGEDVEKIIKGLNAIEVPLLDKSGRMITSIEFEKKEGKWQAIGFGATPAMTSLKSVQVPDSTLKNARLIRIPALHTSFLATGTSTNMNFMALANDPNLELRAGMTLPASQALSRLVPIANQYNGLPQ